MAKKSTSQRKKSTGAKKRPRLTKANVAARIKALHDTCVGPIEHAIVDEMELILLRVVAVHQRIDEVERSVNDAVSEGDVKLSLGWMEVLSNLELTHARLQAAETAKHRVLRAQQRARNEANIAALREADIATKELQERLGLH